MSTPCCGKAVIHGEYKPLNQRLLDYGKEVYDDAVSKKQRTLIWVFSFYDEKANCPVCKGALGEMFGWFHKYNLFKDPIRSVKVVVEPEPDKNLLYTDLHLNQLPVHLFCDSNGNIFDILYDTPNEKWLETYILPIVQADGRPV